MAVASSSSGVKELFWDNAICAGCRANGRVGWFSVDSEPPFIPPLSLSGGILSMFGFYPHTRTVKIDLSCVLLPQEFALSPHHRIQGLQKSLTILTFPNFSV